MSKRTRQVADTIQRVLGDVIQNELKDPRVGFTTVTGVDLSKDLHYARVRVSVMGDEQERAETMAGLKSAAGFLQRCVARELNHLRSVPELRLEMDTSLDYSIHINQLLREVADEEHQTRQDRDTTDSSEA
jgi:ribosome-binding factor A